MTLDIAVDEPEKIKEKPKKWEEKRKQQKIAKKHFDTKTSGTNIYPAKQHKL